jgi:hypothetical protein
MLGPLQWDCMEEKMKLDAMSNHVLMAYQSVLFATNSKFLKANNHI